MTNLNLTQLLIQLEQLTTEIHTYQAELTEIQSSLATRDQAIQALTAERNNLQASNQELATRVTQLEEMFASLLMEDNDSELMAAEVNHSILHRASLSCFGRRESTTL